jgi:hypothetical protein
MAIYAGPAQEGIYGKHYVYVWKNADGVPFYVGKGQGARFMEHIAREDWPLDAYTVEIILAADGCDAMSMERHLYDRFVADGVKLLNKIRPAGGALRDYIIEMVPGHKRLKDFGAKGEQVFRWALDSTASQWNFDPAGAKAELPDDLIETFVAMRPYWVTLWKEYML